MELKQFEGSNEQLFWRDNVDTYDKHAEIIVPETHFAVLIKDGVYMQTLSAGRYPLFDLKGLFFKKKDDSYATIDVVYMSKTAKQTVYFGTREKFKLRDSQTGLPVSIGLSGEMEVQIDNPKQFYLAVAGADQLFTVAKLQEKLQARLISQLEPIFARNIRENNLSFDTLSEHKIEVSNSVFSIIKDMFIGDYGLKLFSFTIGNIAISEEDIAKIIERRKADEVEAKNSTREQMDTARLDTLAEREFERIMALGKAFDKDVLKAYIDKSSGKKPQLEHYCPACGAATNNMNFCPKCGKNQSGTKDCPSCGKSNDSGAMFCASCGQKL